MDYKTKYLKYKQKYLDLQSETKLNIIPANSVKQAGGFKPYEKYILLSCKEFDGLVDQIIFEDSGDIKYNIINEENQLETRTVANRDILTNDSNESYIDETKYKSFLLDIGIKAEQDSTEYNQYKKTYLRKVYNYETEHYYRGFINWKSYNDNTPDIKMNSSTVAKLRGSKVIYFAYFSFNEPGVTMIISQLMFLNSLNHYGVSEINIVLPYFPVGTMERIVGEGEIPTAFALAHMLNSIPSGASKNNIYFFDIHALCSRFFFHTNTIPVLITLMPEYINYIKTTYNKENDLNIIVFPDDGAKKRFEKLIPKDFKKITCGKTRVLDQRIIKIESGMDYITNKSNGKLRLVEGKQINMFIIDDLVQSGGTLTETIKGIISYLKTECPDDIQVIDAIKFDTLVTHSVFPKDENVDKFFSPEEHVNKLVTSNSRPLRVKYIKDKEGDKVEVLSLAPILNKIFTRQGNYEEYVAPYSVN